MDTQEFESLKAYIGFSPRTGTVLYEFHAIAEPHFGRIVSDFCLVVTSHPRARQVLTGGEQQLEVLQNAFLGWLHRILLGPHDSTFLESQSRIGRVHVRVGLPQRYVIGAMNQVRTELCVVAREAYANNLAEGENIAKAVNQVLDLALAILVDAYSEHLNTKLRDTERLATIGQLAASIGHELRNPLGIIQSSLFLLEQRLKRIALDDSVLKKHHERIQKQVLHCGSVITNLLNLARNKSPQRTRFELAEIVRRALELASVPSHIKVDVQVPRELTMYADPEDMLHVIANLITNSVQAQSEGGSIAISAHLESAGTELHVRDTGPGVPPEIAGQIFDALFTTKSRGTGLGLALCRRVLIAHQGEIQLEPSEKGAHFRVWVPGGNDHT